MNCVVDLHKGFAYYGTNSINFRPDPDFQMELIKLNPPAPILDKEKP